MKLVTMVNARCEVLASVLGDGFLLDLGRVCKHPSFLATDLKTVSNDIMKILANEEIDAARAITDWVEKGGRYLREVLLEDAVVINPEGVRYCAAIPRPSFILAQGLAYREHLKEMGVPTPKHPVALVKAPSSLTGTGCPIILPENHPDMVDWEGEFSIVMGKECHNVAEAEAMDYVAGYTIINDVSARDWVPQALNPDQLPMQAVISWGNNVQGKQFPTFTPMGPVFVTKDEIENPNQLRLTTRVNGKIMQDTNTSDLIFSIEKLISHFSKWYLFRPGDVITTGSPAGVGYGMKPQIFLKEGDVVEITVAGIGTLVNPVVRQEAKSISEVIKQNN